MSSRFFRNEEERATWEKLRSEFLEWKEESSKQMEEIRKRIEIFSPPHTSPTSQSLPIMGESNTGFVGTSFMPHIINVKATEDVMMPPDFFGDISSPDGRVVKGVAGILVAASLVQFGVNNRVLLSNQLEPKPKKLKNGSDRPKEFLSLYPEGAENIKGVLQQIVKKKGSKGWKSME